MFVWVTEFGADKTGVLDSSAQIQDAIDYVESLGAGTVFFPSGTYLIGTGLTVEDADVHLVGEGRGSILKASTNITMLTVGPTSGALTANAGNITSRLHFDLNGTSSTGIFCQRWGQIGWYEHIHFTNPVHGSIGIRTEDSATVNELVFQDINWFYNPPLSGGTPVGTGIVIDCNNCKILDSTIIGASVGIEITTTVSADPLIISGNRLRANARGIRANAVFNKGLVIRDNRFEGNTVETYAIDLEGLDSSTNRINSVVISGNRFSSTNGIRLKNVKGCLIDGCVITSTFTPAPTTFITDGGGVSELSTVNLINGEGVSLVHFPPTITDVEATGPSAGLYNILRRTKFGDGIDAPTTLQALVYATRAGQASIAARDSTNDSEVALLTASGTCKVGAITADTFSVVVNNTERLIFNSGGTRMELPSINLVTGVTSVGVSSTTSISWPTGTQFHLAGTSTCATFSPNLSGRKLWVIGESGTTTLAKTGNIRFSGPATLSVAADDTFQAACFGTTWFVYMNA
jgi:hypothetical protein